MFTAKAAIEHELIARKSTTPPRLPTWEQAAPASTVPLVQRKGQCACGGGCPRCQEEAAPQMKLRVSQPGDAYEQEADRVAETVMRMPESEISEETKLSGGPQISRMSAGESEVHRQAAEADEEVSTTEEADEDGIVPDETGMPKLKDHAEVPGPLNHIPRHGGRPLDSVIRNFMEQRFSSDFGHVQLHTDPEAAASAEKLNAQAYTVGRDIYFNQGRYDPGTHAGQKLLAHELTHVIQQTGGREELGVQRTPAGRTRAPAPPACVNTCASGSCPQGKQRRVTRNDCGLNPEPVNPDNYISALNVSLSAKTVQVIWSGLVAGNTEVWPCSPHPSNTPLHSADNPDVVGTKCSVNHTNRHRDGMAWFTGFASEGLRIGFHDSQKVGAGCVSHGCVRVCCDKAEIINKNTWGGRTTITVT